MITERVSFNDLEEIKHLQPEGWPDIIPDFEFYLKTGFCNPIKIIENGKIAGVGVSILYKNTAWLAHIIVDSNYRRKGIGTLIVKELLDFIEKHSIKSCSLVATELGKPVYLKAGFKIVTEYVFLKRENPWIGKQVPGNIIPFSEIYRSQVYELDKKISGEHREILLNPYLKSSFVFTNNNLVLGFYIPDLKEGLIYSETREAGLELMNVKYSLMDKAVLPQENTTGIEFLKHKGFIESDMKGTRMILGKDIEWEPTKIYSRIGGNLG